MFNYQKAQFVFTRLVSLIHTDTKNKIFNTQTVNCKHGKACSTYPEAPLVSWVVSVDVFSSSAARRSMMRDACGSPFIKLFNILSTCHQSDHHNMVSLGSLEIYAMKCLPVCYKIYRQRYTKYTEYEKYCTVYTI